MGKINFKKSQLITMGAAIGVGLFNPFTVEVLEQYFKDVYFGLFLACVAWILVYLIRSMFKQEPVKVTPKKNKKDGMKYEMV